MPEESGTPSIFRFGLFELSTETGELRKNGIRLRLFGQPIQVLTLLVKTPGQLVTREKLQQSLWPEDTYTDFERGLNAAISRLREKLGDSATAPTYIETLPGRGYRFMAPVERASDAGRVPTPVATQRTPPSYKKWVLVGCAMAAILIALLLLGSGHPLSSPSDSLSRKAIALLPFRNVGSDHDTDFLGVALPDEIATTLSYVPSFSIRPPTMRFRYNYPSLYLQQAGRALGATSIVSGHYVTEGDQLEITLEAVDVDSNRIVWRDTIHTTTSDKIAMREQITSRVRQRLVPALGGPSGFRDTGTRPESEEAYNLYLHSIAVQHLDPAFNKQAILMLEQAVGIDPGYAPAWEALGLRYYFDSLDGGDQTFKRSDSAFERALALDPNLIPASTQLTANRTERGEIVTAYAEASALVKRLPENASAHIALAYVLRYVGLLDESAHECNAALALDPGDISLRSCAWVFIYLGQSQRAMVFVDLNRGSDWTAYITPFVLLEQGRLQEAREAASRMPPEPRYGREFVQACLDPEQASSRGAISGKSEAAALAAADPERRYFFGRLLAFCGQKEASFHVLKSAIGHNYCANSALLYDPFLAKLRGDPEFTVLQAASKECLDSFLRSKTTADVVGH